MTAPEWNILKLLDWTTTYFTDHGVPSPRLDAELLLSDILKLRRIDLYLNFEKPVAPSDLARFKSLIQRRGKREPLQYILGHADFYGRQFSVTPDVLIPRPETEQLVVRAMEWLDAHPDATRVLDIGTGSGCIAITLALERPSLNITAMDVSEKALAVAKGNATSLGVTLAIVTGDAETSSEGSPLLRGDGRSAAAGPVTMASYDLIISNPPYIPTGDIADLQTEVSRFEPHLALDGGEDGLAFYRQLLLDAPPLLKSGGACAMEIGLGQRKAITDIASSIGLWQTPQCFADLSGTERILIFERKD